MKVNTDLEINAPATEVWKVLGSQFSEIATWCATVKTSRPRQVGKPLLGAPSTGRECDTIYGHFTETFLEYSNDTMGMYYEVTSKKLPFFIKGFFNRYAVKPLGPQRSLVSMRAGAKMMQPFGWLMSPMMERQMGKSLTNQVEELKHFIETGKPHPRKIEAMQATNR